MPDVTNPTQFAPKDPALFYRRESNYGGRYYGVRPSVGPGRVADAGIRMSVVDVPGSDTYAYPGRTTEPKPSKEFTAVHEVMTQVTHDTGRFYPSMAHHLVEMGEREHQPTRGERDEECGLLRGRLLSEWGSRCRTRFAYGCAWRSEEAVRVTPSTSGVCRGHDVFDREGSGPCSCSPGHR